MRNGVLLFRGLEGVEDLGGDGAGGLRADFAAAIGAGAFRQAGHQDFQVIVDLRDRADGRAGGLDVVGLLDGDGRRDAVDGIDLRLVHALHELPGIGAEGLDVAALALRVDGIEGEAGLPAAAGAGDDVELPERDIEVEALQIILADTADLDGIALETGVGSDFFKGRGSSCRRARFSSAGGGMGECS